MKEMILFVFLSLFVLVPVTIGQNNCKNRTIEQLANEIARAFQNRNLQKVDKTRPFLKRITVRTENSLSEDTDPDRFEYKTFKNFTQFERSMKKNEIEGYPNRSTEPLISCKKGICRYNIVGLLHNTLFLQKLSYSYKKNNCPYIKSVFLIDGN